MLACAAEGRSIATRTGPVAAVIGGLGVVLTLAALLDGRGVDDDALAVRLTFSVPDGLILTSAVAFALAGIVILTIARRRKDVEEDPDPDAAALGLPWWARALVEIFLVVPLLLMVWVLWLDGGRFANLLLSLGRTWFPSGDALPGVPESPVVALPWLGWSVGLLAVAVALATLGLALLLLFGERLIAWLQARRERDEDVAPFAEAVDESLDDLADETDPRRAIIRCYRRFEQAAAKARVPRAGWQTPDEFMRDALGRLPAPRHAVEGLTRLFELARFSHHPVRSVDRDVARECLEEIGAALEPSEARVAAT